jgi:ribosome-associated protein
LNTLTKSEQLVTEQELNDLIIDAIQDIKGKNIIKLDLSELHDAPTNTFIICEGESTTQVKAISENIKLRLKKELGEYPVNSEGQESSTWICIDYFNTVVHVFYPETRKFYELEELWSDARFTEYQDL